MHCSNSVATADPCVRGWLSSRPPLTLPFAKGSSCMILVACCIRWRSYQLIYRPSISVMRRNSMGLSLPALRETRSSPKWDYEYYPGFLGIYVFHLPECDIWQVLKSMCLFLSKTHQHKITMTLIMFNMYILPRGRRCITIRRAHTFSWLSIYELSIDGCVCAPNRGQPCLEYTRRRPRTKYGAVCHCLTSIR